MENIGYKVFTKHKGKLYSYALGWFKDYILYDEHTEENIKKERKKYKEVFSKIVRYKKFFWTKGKPWVAIFDTKENALEYLDICIGQDLIIKRIKYKKILEIPTLFLFISAFINDHGSSIMNSFIPEGTIFVDKIKIIRNNIFYF